MIVWICSVTASLRVQLCWDGAVTERKPYPSDLTDAQWALIEPVLTAWKAAHSSVSGHEGNYALREIVNAIRYQGRTGVQWDYPARSAAQGRDVLLLRQMARRRHRQDDP
ncbi:transposase [Nonomuraea sediminis]|uniref:transposase n=1 Tax=Nonomuraea sediminis TaxID=2835864 RepID=UPI001BDD4292